MRKTAIIVLSLLFGGTVSAQVSIPAGRPAETERPAADAAAGERIWTEFHAAEIEGAMRVRFLPADAEHPVGIGYSAADFKDGKFVNKVEDGVLKLKMRRSRDTLQVTVRYNKLDAVTAAEAAVAFDGVLAAHSLDVKVSGGATFEAVLDVSDLKLEVTGTSRVILSGKTRYMDAVVSTASVDAGRLEAMAVGADASHKAEVTVRATDRIVMRATTGAVIRYAGMPAIERSNMPSILSGSLQRITDN